MWTANAATVTPSADSGDGRLHLTPANLRAMFHRSIEHEQTERFLRTMFDGDHFAVHQAIPGGGEMGDEGAANHGRLAKDHGAPGLPLFTFGREAFDKGSRTAFPARQALEASRSVARQHGVGEDRSVFFQQSAEAIDAGAFHNDVVGVANGPAFLFHALAYENKGATLDEIQRKAEALGFEPIFIEVSAEEVSLADAVSSYLFNSQLLTAPDGGMKLLLPVEAEENPRTKAWCEAAVSGNDPIEETIFMDLRQSMRNGGGPACLRLRVVATEAEIAAMHQGFLLTEEKIDRLEKWVREHYRDRLSESDLLDPQLLEENRKALDELTQIMGAYGLYGFQR
jgi:succinylarginine dihydrolase